VEFKGFDNVNLGDNIDVNIFEEGEYVSIIGTTKGKGVQKRIIDLQTPYTIN
jgi:large subunit ribosomal protein L3